MISVCERCAAGFVTTRSRYRFCKLCIREVRIENLKRTSFQPGHKGGVISPQCRAATILKARTLRGPKSAGFIGHGMTSAGYVTLTVPQEDGHWKARLEHVLIAERVLGRRLRKGEVVHHIDGDRANNKNSNLLICTHAYHRWFHEQMSLRYQIEHFRVAGQDSTEENGPIRKYQKECAELALPGKGPSSNRFKGVGINTHGYREISVPGKNGSWKYRYEHVLAAERLLGRKLKDEEVVHHIDGNRLNNKNSNLLICTIGYHRWLHGIMSLKYQIEHFQREKDVSQMLPIESADGKRQWGLRSPDRFDVTGVAKKRGGGGHPSAAGFVEDLNK